MRLVNVDKFINDFPIQLNHYDEENGSKNFVLGIETVLDSLDCTPTVEAIPIKDIKDFLRCEKIDTCEWLNCSECSQMNCISIRNLSDLIEWSKERNGERK